MNNKGQAFALWLMTLTAGTCCCIGLLMKKYHLLFIFKYLIILLFGWSLIKTFLILKRELKLRGRIF